ncbi:hypothetical protein DFQ27_008726 [Actinomortierella ambigua]|uniref:Uncharacterized protein n=1 Tax=Actinomortierella ambigua TaxID=1343610 RepID=A0A9P6PPU9_9FUNG|nr:hypothetical protein DFQ27_008726 [Actinomortierella ambigua]
MSKYAPLFDLHKITQLLYTSTGKFSIYSRVLLDKHHLHSTTASSLVHDLGTEAWVLSAFSGTSWFERKYHEDELDDLLEAAGDVDWASFTTRVKRAIQSGHMHLHEVSHGRECVLTIDNELATSKGGGESGGGSSSEATRTGQQVELRVELTRVATETKNQQVCEFVFDLVEFAQRHGCMIGGPGEGRSSRSTTGVDSGNENVGNKDFESLKLERDNYKNEAAQLKQQLERLQASVSSMPGGSQLVSGGTSRPRSKAGKNAMLSAHLANKKRKGQSLVNPRVRAVPKAKGTEFDDDDDDEDG